MRYAITVIVLLPFIMLAVPAETVYEPTWESLDQRPNPEWFTDAKFGIFIHWGVYSVPAWGPKDRYSEWYWHDMQNKEGETWQFHERVYGADFPYTHFAHQFKAELFDPVEWADIFARAGARYVVLTSKHHDGYALWPSEQSWNWNSMDIGPQRDLCGELTEAVRAEGLRMGFYYSFYEWFNPLYHRDVHAYVDQHMLPQLMDLVQRYQPDIVWPDGEWDHPSVVWRSRDFLAWLFNHSDAPEDVAINDRWGRETRAVHGGFATPEYQHISEGRLMDAGRLEECQGMGKSFGYNRNENVDDYRSTAELLELLIDTVSRGGNLLLDIGPAADGRIPVIMQQRLIEIGEWLDVNGEAIYGSRRWRENREGDKIRYTTKDGVVYAILLGWPGDEVTFETPQAGDDVTVSMLGVDEPLTVRMQDDKLIITMPVLTPDRVPCDHHFVLRLEGVE